MVPTLRGRPHAELTGTLINSERVYQGRIVSLRIDDVRLPNGKLTKREVVEHRGAVALVALLPGPKVILVRQWRHAVGEALLEIPAGTLEQGEEPLECARRELAEETGYDPGRIEPLVDFYSSPGFTTERLHVFLARDLRPARASPDEDEFIQLLLVDWNDALAMCHDGRIKDAKTIAGILAADRRVRAGIGEGE